MRESIDYFIIKPSKFDKIYILDQNFWYKIKQKSQNA